MFFLKMWKRKKLEKKIKSLELDLGQINAIIISNKKVLSKIYGEYNISKVQMEIESNERSKINIEIKLDKFKNDILLLK